MGFKKKTSTDDGKKKQKIDRLTPVDSNNEQLLLSYAMTNADALDVLVSEVEHDDFLFVNHKALLQCMKHLKEQNVEVTIDAIDAVKLRFDHGEKVNIDYLMKLKAAFPDEINEASYQFHIRKLRDDKVKDDLYAEALPSFIEDLRNTKNTTEDLAAKLTEIQQHVEEKLDEKTFRFIGAAEVDQQHTDTLRSREENLVFGSTGYRKLDERMTDGFSRKKISIVAGRPGMCKSSFIANCHLRLGLQGIPSALYPFEMDGVSMFDRMVSIEAQIKLENIIKYRERLTPEERQREAEVKARIRELPILFYTGSTQTMDGVKRDLRILRERHNIQVVSYDLFKKMKFNTRRSMSTADMLSENLDQIQAWGKDFDIHQILVVQISRKAESRRNNRPKLSDLKDSGGFEEVADNVILLYRRHYYEMDENEENVSVDVGDHHELELHLAKQRQGGGNKKVTLDFFPATTSITETQLNEVSR